LEREESWRGYNPDAPYDTIPIYGTGSNEVVEFKVVKAEQYSVPHGDWKFYNPQGHIVKIETYERGALQKPNGTQARVEKKEQPKEKEKPQEILDYEKKYSKKKRAQMERDGKTSL
jgi:hypothetical protein